ncbi:MAG: hypothetical protein Kow00105_16680 [Phycisphaeraceae bacterium]
MSERSLLRPLGITARLGLTLIVLTLLGGLIVSGIYLRMHHENRDEQPGLTMMDIRGHYTGVNVPAPLLSAIERGHPEGLPDASRKVLIDWLKSDRISEDYDNLDLGAMAPAEIIADSCLSCHSRQSEGEGTYAKLPLDFYDDVIAVAVSRDIRPVGTEVLAASTHTHAIGLSLMALASCGLLLLTGWSRKLANPIVLMIGLGLAMDLSGWWIARMNDSAVPMIVAGGFLFAAGVTIALLLVLADLWRPGKTA